MFWHLFDYSFMSNTISMSSHPCPHLHAIWLNLLPGTKKFDACNHARAYEYYRESIVKSKGFVGYPCSDKDSFAAVSFCFIWENLSLLDGTCQNRSFNRTYIKITLLIKSIFLGCTQASWGLIFLNAKRQSYDPFLPSSDYKIYFDSTEKRASQ